MSTPGISAPREKNPPKELIDGLKKKYPDYNAAWIEEYATYLCFRQDPSTPFDWICNKTFVKMYEHCDVITLETIANYAVTNGVLPEHAFKDLCKANGITPP
ncbi:MAG: hypothetical protein ABW189_01025 [Rickettsiales bacterium]